MTYDEIVKKFQRRVNTWPKTERTGGKLRKEFDNFTYGLWNDGKISMKALEDMVNPWETEPLTSGSLHTFRDVFAEFVRDELPQIKLREGDKVTELRLLSEWYAYLTMMHLLRDLPLDLALHWPKPYGKRRYLGEEKKG